MKKILMVLVAVAAVTMAGIAMAAPPFDTTVNVSATVTGNCRFTNTGSASVSFTLDPAIGGLVNGTVTQPTFWCTKGTNFTITDDYGSNKSGTTHRMQRGTSGEYIQYSFTYTSTGSGTGKSNPLSMDIAATVANADYVDATAGSYTDLVTLTITP